jgi:hypothetical protein
MKEACFTYCTASYVSEANLLANVINKSNKRKSRVQCKCFDSSSGAVAVSCEDAVLDASDSPNSNGRGRGKKSDGRRLMRRGGNGKGKGKGRKGKCRKCMAIKCSKLDVLGARECSTVTPVPAPV